ncbi:MAG: outer membrane beta-barrel protein [Pseudomonadota bacterium]
MRKKFFAVILQPILFIGLFCSSGIAGDGFGWDRFLIKPEITVEEQYSDNVFLGHTNVRKDSITTFSPALSGYLAFTDSSRLGAHYKGDFSYYSKYDELNEKDNEGAVDWSMRMPAGSTFSVGANILDTSIQPDQPYQPEQPNLEDGKEKPYLLKTVFTDSNLKVGEFTEVGFRYEFKSREFDESSYAEDDYDRNLFVLDYVNRYFPRFPFLLEYRYTINDRDDSFGAARDSRSNAVYVGARWTPETRLSGNLRIGYQNTDYEGIRDVDSLVVNTALSYRLTEMTTLQLRVNRTLEDSTTVENEVGYNYTFTTWEGNIHYRYSDPLKFSFRLRYQDKEYDETNPRNDDIYNTRIGIDYTLNRWVDFSLSYQYKENKSDSLTEEYKENSGYFGVRLSL